MSYLTLNLFTNYLFDKDIIVYSNQLQMDNTVQPADQFFNIVQGMIERDEASLAALYELTLPKVYGLALKITRRHDLAEEVAEDTQGSKSVNKGKPLIPLHETCQSAPTRNGAARQTCSKHVANM